MRTTSRPPRGGSATEELLSDIRQDQEDIGEEFYTKYKEARHELLHDIWKRNPKTRRQFDRAIEKAQTIIDRIVFSCFAEDRGLLPDNTVMRVKQWAGNSYAKDPLWTQFKGFFAAVDSGSDKLGIPDGYNGGLFAEDPALDALEISDAPLEKLVALSDYNFVEDLSVTILGHIFEQSITDLEELKRTVNEQSEKDEFAIPIGARAVGRRKKDGIFYTPDYVVRYIVKSSLGAYLERHEESLKRRHNLTRKDADEELYAKREQRVYLEYQTILQAVKVLDPACGSGAFLVHVVDYLIHENQRVDNILGGSLSSMEEYVKGILTNNIFGVDINEESVEITQLSLWLKTAIKGKKLTALNGNILCGNALIEDQAVPGANWFDFAKGFPEIMATGGFDVIVGNPPYVRVQNIQRPHIDHFFEKYKTPAGKMDISIVFFERALQLLKPDGVAAFVSSSQWMQTDYGKNLRKLLSTGKHLSEIIDFGSLPVFKGASTYPAVFTMSKKALRTAPTYSRLTGADQLNEGSIVAAPRKQLDAKNLTEAPWQFGDFKLIDHLKKARKSYVEFSEAGHAYIGDLTGRDDTFVISSAKAKELALEPDLLIPYANRAGEIYRYREVAADSLVIYPYRQGEKSEAVLLLPEELKNKCPNIFDYLERDRPLLEQRLDSRRLYATGDQWFRHLRPGNFSHIIPAKFMIKGIDKRVVMGTIGANTAFNGANCTGVIIENAEYSKDYIYGLFNSRLISYYLNQVVPPKLNNTFRYNASNLNAVPIIGKDDQKIEALVVNLATQYGLLDEHSSRFRTMMESEVGAQWPNRTLAWWESDYLPLLKKLKVRATLVKKDEVFDFWKKYHHDVTGVLAEITELEEQLDQRVYAIYGLTEEQVQIVESYFATQDSVKKTAA
ncbi:N-6 DNA methylase [Mycobacteroides abscessus subsp. abscessus]|uniref:Eco57I restriction-modification methylase domain-containing protein n=1 Tax=Mycobacteroides abscessus TaxID=36809 RepID=UPI00232FC5CF|nr:N-6 DNA methylase [Mycobacteroides abscessus]MDB2230012.1 N-6 DNA methylase [Mycobacteroides abscessus subsp. abscessus]